MHSVPEAAAILGLRPSHVRNLARTGVLVGAKKLGRDWFIPRESIEAYRASERRPGPKRRSEPR